jgi:hypothetical protein
MFGRLASVVLSLLSGLVGFFALLFSGLPLLFVGALLGDDCPACEGATVFILLSLFAIVGLGLGATLAPSLRANRWWLWQLVSLDVWIFYAEFVTPVITFGGSASRDGESFLTGEELLFYGGLTAVGMILPTISLMVAWRRRSADQRSDARRPDETVGAR